MATASELNDWHSRCDQNLYDAELAARSAYSFLSYSSTVCWWIRDRLFAARAKEPSDE